MYDSIWQSHEFWLCKRHLPTAKLPAACEICWYGGCPSTRPPMKDRPKPPSQITKTPVWEHEVKNTSKCAWKDCENTARSKSIYCSRNCSNKNARWRHKMRRLNDSSIGT